MDTQVKVLSTSPKDLIPVLGNYLIKGEKIQVILEFMNGMQLCSHTSTKCIKKKKISENLISV